MIPVLNPAGVQEILDYGLYGWALSRFSGAWVGLKAVKDTIEIHRHRGRAPRPGGASSRRLPASTLPPGRPQHPPRRHRARPGGAPPGISSATPCIHFLRANRLNRFITSGGSRARASASPPWARAIWMCALLWTSWALTRCAPTTWGCASGRWPAPGRWRPRACGSFASGLDLIMVVEEKRSLIEVQVREELYGTANQPVCIGKKDEEGRWLFPVKGALDPNDIAIAARQAGCSPMATFPDIAARVAELEEAQRVLAATGGRGHPHPLFLFRLPAQFLHQGSGRHARLCRHRLPLHGAVDGPGDHRLHPDGRRGRQLDRGILRSPNAPTSSRISATAPTTIRATSPCAPPCAAKVNVTYKILFNDAVAMTGGQKPRR